MFHSTVVNRVFQQKRIASKVRFPWDKGVILFLIFFIAPLLSIIWSGNGTGEKQGYVYPETSRLRVEISTPAQTFKMGMETYLTYALAGVMPGDYEKEALKAQAVLLRTRLLYLWQQQEEPKDTISLTAEKCFFEEAGLRDGEWKKIRQAVKETAGIYLSGGERPAWTSWFALSAGQTREGGSLSERMGGDYLKSVPCEKDYQSSGYLQQKVIQKKDYEFLLKMYFGEILKNTKGKKQALQILKLELTGSVQDEAGYASEITFEALCSDQEGTQQRETLIIGGEQFRTLFELPSSHMEILQSDKEICITTRGQGHGYGLSQYAANELAAEGMDYAGILNTFFTNIAIDKFE